MYASAPRRNLGALATVPSQLLSESVTGAATVVVTRPGTAGRRLVDELDSAGQAVLWLPAFDFGPAPDEAAARATLKALADFDVAVFVSPQAARAAAALIDGRWPEGTAIAAVGSGTRAAVLSAIDGADRATTFAPAAADRSDSGSESLWPVLQQVPRLRRVLLLRAQAGREWLTERLAQAGATVVPLAVYSRNEFAPPAQLRSQLAQAAPGGLSSVISSSDAVGSLVRMLNVQPEVLRALQRGPAMAAHPRIAERLRAAGFARVILCAPECTALLAALREG
jgi:uroporphyrinogen-III synthase